MSSIHEIKQALFKCVDHFQPPFDIYEYTYEDTDDNGDTFFATRDVIVYPNELASHDASYESTNYYDLDNICWFMTQKDFEKQIHTRFARLISKGTGVVKSPAELPYIHPPFSTNCQIDEAFTTSEAVRSFIATQPIYVITIGWSFDNCTSNWFYIDLRPSEDLVDNKQWIQLFYNSVITLNLLTYILDHMRFTIGPSGNHWYEIELPDTPGATLVIREIVRLR